MKNMLTKQKVYKGVSHTIIMKKSGDLRSSCVFPISLTLKKHNDDNLCSNFGVTTTS